MNIAFLPTDTSYDVQCPVCGRGFLLLSEPTLSLQRGSLRQAARKALAAQHDGPRGKAAHADEVTDLVLGDDDEAAPSRAPWVEFTSQMA